MAMAAELSGTIPEGLSALVALRQLDLSLNQFEGAVPEQLCRGGRASSITDIILTFNKLSGGLDVVKCGKLVYLEALVRRHVVWCHGVCMEGHRWVHMHVYIIDGCRCLRSSSNGDMRVPACPILGVGLLPWVNGWGGYGGERVRLAS